MRNALYCIGVVGLSLGLGGSQAQATLYTFDLEGTFNAPIIEKGFHKNSYFEHHISTVRTSFARGQLTMTYDDRGTEGLFDDALAIHGTSSGCHVSTWGECSTTFAGSIASKGWKVGFLVGPGEFDWNIELEQPTAGANLNDHFDGLTFAMQDAGTLTIRAQPALHNPVSGLERLTK